MKRREIKGSITKNDGSINHTSKVDSLTVKDSAEKVSSILNDSRIMGIRINDCTHNIIEVTTKCVFIYFKDKTTIGMAKPNQLLNHLKDIMLNNHREFRMKFERSRDLKLEEDDGKRRIINIRKR